MKIKLFFTLFFVIVLFCSIDILAQEANNSVIHTNTFLAEENAINDRINAKIKAHQTTEADLADEFKAIDNLIAKENGAKTDEAAQLVYMKAFIYFHVILNTEKGNEIIKELKQNYKDTPTVARIEKQEATALARKKIRDSFTNGVPFPDFSETDLNGKPLSVANYKGKVVLVDFWATWCPPCRAELPNVIATYKKHHADGFEIIGVSLDSDRNKLDEFLKKTDGMTWPEFFDGKGWQNKLVGKYGIEWIPFNILVGSDGKIIGKEFHGEDLEKAVASALAKKN